MKIRNSFISNSSSSSFVVAVTEEAHEEAMENLSKKEKELISLLMTKKKIVGNQKLIMGGYYSSAGGDGTFEWIAEEEDIKPDEHWDAEELGASYCYSLILDKYLDLIPDNQKITIDVGDGR